MRDATRADLARLVDIFTGADGGADFVRLRALLESLDGQAANGNAPAAECLAVMRRFRRLCDAASAPQAARAP